MLMGGFPTGTILEFPHYKMYNHGAFFFKDTKNRVAPHTICNPVPGLWADNGYMALDSFSTKYFWALSMFLI